RQGSAKAFGIAEEVVPPSNRQLIQQIEVHSVADVSSRMAAYRAGVAVVVRLRGEDSLILHVVNRVRPGVVDIVLETRAEPPFQRDLQSVIDILASRRLDVDIAELRIRRQFGYSINEVDVQITPQIEAVIAEVRDLNRVVPCQLARHGQSPMLNINITLDPIEAGDGRGWPHALREEWRERIRKVRNLYPVERRVAGDVVDRHRIGTEAHWISLPEDAVPAAHDGFAIRLPGDAKARGEVARVGAEEGRVGRRQIARARVEGLRALLRIVRRCRVVVAQS